jgi:hypothetical protein
MLSPVETFIHRDYVALLAAVPALAIGSIAVFAARDRAARSAPSAAAAAGPAVSYDDLAALLNGAEGGGADELALIGVVLAAMAERLEHDPAAYPLLARAAARLVPPRSGTAVGAVWTGLTERARRAAIDVLRPTALTTLVRAGAWGLLSPREGAA